MESGSPSRASDQPVRLMTLDPGQFHAALIHREMLAGVSPRIDVYAPPGPDLDEHLARLAAFATRTERPTRWEVEVHAGADYLDRMIAERPGNAVVIAGRNARKMTYVARAVQAGLHVLADKPWIIRPADLPLLATTLESAERGGVVAYDVMTERYEVTNAVQRELVNDPAIFGGVVTGSPSLPAVHLRSVHHILKSVSGVPLRRPLWWFDASQQGEALSDVGPHLVDLALWTLFPEQALDAVRDVALISARRWQTWLERDQFRRVTGAVEYPPELAGRVRDASIGVDCNTEALVGLRGIHVRVEALWEVESGHGDTHFASYRGTRATVEVRQGEAEGWRPEVYVAPVAAEQAAVGTAVRRRVERMAERWPGVGVEERGEELRISIPDRHRLGHERHFAEVAKRFIAYVADPGTLPAWERSNMLVKYFVTTRGTELSRGARPGEPPGRA